MRKALIGILLAATAVTPVTAAFAQDRGDRNRGSIERVDRGDRESARQATPQRASPQRQATAQRTTTQPKSARASSQRQVATQGPDRGHAPAARQGRSTRQVRPQVQQQPQQRARVQQQAQQRARVQQQAQHRPRVQQQPQQRARVHQQAQQRWNGNWRQNQSYNWQQHRQVNRTVFRMPVYHAPYPNYRYSRQSVGISLGSNFLHQRYLISDPWQYRLPAAYPGSQWVRYYNDVLLVDMRSGQVIDVIHDFFW